MPGWGRSRDQKRSEVRMRRAKELRLFGGYGDQHLLFDGALPQRTLDCEKEVSLGGWSRGWIFEAA